MITLLARSQPPSRWLAAAAVLWVSVSVHANTLWLPHGHQVRQLLAAQRLHAEPRPANQRPEPSLDGMVAQQIVLKYRQSFGPSSATPTGGGNAANSLPSVSGAR